jgi:hypothetical protein
MSSCQKASSLIGTPGAVIVLRFRYPLYSITLYRENRLNQIRKAFLSPARISPRWVRGMIRGNPSAERDTATLRPRVPSSCIPPTACIKSTLHAFKYRTKPGLPDLASSWNAALVKTTVALVQDGFFPTRIRSTIRLNQLIQPLPDFTLVILLKRTLSSRNSPERNILIKELVFLFICVFRTFQLKISSVKSTNKGISP